MACSARERPRTPHRAGQEAASRSRRVISRAKAIDVVEGAGLVDREALGEAAGELVNPAGLLELLPDPGAGQLSRSAVSASTSSSTVSSGSVAVHGAIGAPQRRLRFDLLHLHRSIPYDRMGSLYGFEVESELPLQRLNWATGTRGALTIERAPQPFELPERDPDGVLEDDQGRRWYASYDFDDGRCLMCMPPAGSFVLDVPNGRVLVEDGGTDEELLEHRIGSSVICTLLAQRSDLALHAAAVEVEGAAVIFCGPTHRGKSTLARTLGDAGRPLLAEDGLTVAFGDGRAIAYPGARGVRIRTNGTADRPRVELLPDPGPREPQPCPVAAIVLLGERGARLEVEALEPARALALLTPNLIHAGSRRAIGAAFSRLAALLQRTPAFSAAFPNDLGRLPVASAELLDKIADPG